MGVDLNGQLGSGGPNIPHKWYGSSVGRAVGQNAYVSLVQV